MSGTGQQRTKPGPGGRLGDSAPRTFLLFAGSEHPPRGGLGDLVDTFSSEATAREAFRQFRTQEASPASWAQLAVVDDQNRIKPLCWFGIGAAMDTNRARPRERPNRAPTDPTSVARVVVASRRPYVSKRTVALLTALVALAVAMVGFLVDTDGRERRTPEAPAVRVVPHVSAPAAPFPMDTRKPGVEDGGSFDE